MKVAAIDVGSNSIHMIVVEAEAGSGLRVLDREKDMVRLGDGAFKDGRLSASAQARALSTIDRFLRIARRRGVDAVLCAATSAVREAANGRQFLQLVRRETGQHVALLGEHEEARLIYLAVRAAMDLRGRASLIVDVGGGSTEVIVGDATSMRRAESLPLGVLRLNARFHGERALPRRRRKVLREHVREILAPMLSAAQKARVRRVIGTAGTVNAIARLLVARDDGRADGDASSVAGIATEEIGDLAEMLLSTPLSKRRRIPGLDPARADTLGLGAVVLHEVLRGVAAPAVDTCRAAVREGMVLDHLATHPDERGRRGTHDVRERSVRDAAARYGDGVEHGEHVARLAGELFDGTRRLHGLGAEERELLTFGCLLHDVGCHVEYRRHHRHGHYLVKNAELRGFDDEEIEMLAVMVRYHRRGGPKDDQEEWTALPRRLRPTALRLLAILRVADGLDRGHAGEVRSLSARVQRDAVVLSLSGRRDLEVDVWAAAEKADLFEQVFGRPVRFA
jgi:exopolyphosphatase / guanosine-5'-triphosphate,3'-diphosphate pyrophosphatase